MRVHQPPRRLLLLPLATLCTSTEAWAVGHTGSADVLNGDSEILRWNVAPSAGGQRTDIAWALAPNVCDESSGLLRLLPEETLLQGSLTLPQLFGCGTLRRSVRKAMAAWEAANSNIRFFDVSSLCTDAWNSTLAATPSACHGALLPDGQCLACPHAQLVVASYTPATPGEVADVQIRTSAAAPMVGTADYQPGQWQFTRTGDTDPQLCRVSGVCEWQGGFPPLGAADGQTIVSAALLLSAADTQCYWSDADVCPVLFERQASHGAGLDVAAALDAGFYTLFAIGLVMLVVITVLALYRMFQTMLLSWDTDGDGIVEYHEVKAAFAMYFRMASARRRGGGAGVATVAEEDGSARGETSHGSNHPSSPAPGGAAAAASSDEADTQLVADQLEQRRIPPKDAIYAVLDTIASLDYFLWCTALLLLLYPTSYRNAVVRPCFDCDDLSATLTKGLGRVLGLHAKPSPLPTDAAGGPAAYYYTTADERYNCSAPLRGVSPLNTALAAGESLMGTPTRASAAAADWAAANLSTVRCPTQDDAAGLRALYPECDQLLSCQYGWESVVSSPPPPPPPPSRPLDASVSPPPPPPPQIAPPASSGCLVYSRNYTNAQPGTDAGGAYRAADYYAYALAETDEQLQYGGRVLAPPTCHETGDTEHTGVYRSLELLLQTLVVPLCAILLIKLLAVLVRALPALRDVRERNRALKRTAALRKAEVRRMSEGGQKFMVKRLAAQAALEQGHGSKSVKDWKAAALAQVDAQMKISAVQRLQQGALEEGSASQSEPVQASTAVAVALRQRLNQRKLALAAAAAGSRPSGVLDTTPEIGPAVVPTVVPPRRSRVAPAPAADEMSRGAQ